MNAVVKETIGECELCGLVDHHLVEGICPQCTKKCTNVPPVDAPLHDQPTEYDESLGFEAYVGSMEIRGALHRLDAKFRNKR